MSVYDSEISNLKGVGEKRARLFGTLGVRTLGDLIRLYPRSYLDFATLTPIADTTPGETCCIAGIVTSPVRKAIIRKGMTLYKLRVADDTGTCELTYFNNRFIPDLLKTGLRYLFYGRMGGSFFKREMASPEFETGEAMGMLPIYPATEGLSPRTVRSAVRQALAFSDTLTDPMPDALRRRYGLCHLRFAIENIHFPKNHEDLSTARRRLVFEELLSLELGMLSLKKRTREASGAVCPNPPDFAAFYANLPFRPTGAQLRAIGEATADMARGVPMNRLLEGDVGSGKTVVAAALCLYAAQNGYQAALMAPTEILAAQHYKTLSGLLECCGLRVGLLSGGQKTGEKRRIYAMLEAHALDVIVGTHALLQQTVTFDNLGLVVTDEQHRFGVAQRATLAAKGRSPHTLIMSATPIPRTLALIIYGDLDVSVLDELPAGRQSILTYCVDSGKRERIYAFLRKHLDEGRQAYIVCPLVEADESGLASAEEYAQQLAHKEFQAYRVGMLHGRMKGREKEEIMRAFAAGELQLLVSTTVIEVGVDVPNAVVMVVENAERFGLSQLHQLRGRVGRGAAQSYCVLISDARSQETLQRLKALVLTTDGFAIAEKDLQLRGPGDFFGRRQHGLPEFAIASLIDDMEILRQTQDCAREILESDPRLQSAENRGLKEMTQRLFGDETIVFN